MAEAGRGWPLRLTHTLVTAIAPEQPFTLIARPTPVQQRARDLLGLSRTQ